MPVLPILKKVLDDHRAPSRYKADSDYIFAGERGASLNLANWTRRVIIPKLTNKRRTTKRGPLCRKSRIGSRLYDFGHQNGHRIL